jgi:hypothetical protein
MNRPIPLPTGHDAITDWKWAISSGSRIRPALPVTVTLQPAKVLVSKHVRLIGQNDIPGTHRGDHRRLAVAPDDNVSAVDHMAHQLNGR